MSVVGTAVGVGGTVLTAMGIAVIVVLVGPTAGASVVALGGNVGVGGTCVDSEVGAVGGAAHPAARIATMPRRTRWQQVPRVFMGLPPVTDGEPHCWGTAYPAHSCAQVALSGVIRVGAGCPVVRPLLRTSSCWA